MRDRVRVLLTICILVGVLGFPHKGKALPTGANLVEMNGLSWLSPTWSQNISYADMSNLLSNQSSEYFGLRVPTVYEVVNLFNSLPLVHPAFSNPFSIDLSVDDDRVFGPAYGMMDPFYNEFGWHELGVAPEYSRVLSGNSWDPVEERLMVVGVSESDIYSGAASSDHYELTYFAHDVSVVPERSYYGTWLVKVTPIPEPSTIILLSVG